MSNMKMALDVILMVIVFMIGIYIARIFIEIISTFAATGLGIIVLAIIAYKILKD